MSGAISKQAFQRLELVHDKVIRVAELRTIDKNHDGTITPQEAASRGIRSNNDLTALNTNLKRFEGCDPVQIVFNSDRTVANPSVIDPREQQELSQRFGTHGEKGAMTKTMIKAADIVVGSVGDNAVRDNAQAIKDTAERYNLNPKMIAAIVYEEMAHQFPPKYEDGIVCAVKENRCSMGLSQIGAGELIKQGWFASEGIGPTAPDSSLSADQLKRARTHLSVPANNLDVLAKKLVRLQNKLGLPPGITNQNTYAGAHAIAQLTYLHNGFTDYSPRIAETMRAPHLLNALGKIAP